MQLGLFMMPLHPPEKSRTQCFEEDIAVVEIADQMGFTEVWVGQHHTLSWEPIPANDLFLSTLIPRTKNIRLGTGVSIVPQHHPANIAVRLAMLDHLSHGRLNCGFGQGGVPTDWELFDLPDPKTQGLMTVEGIDMVTKLWTTDPPFDFQGKFWRIRIQSVNKDLEMGYLLKPYQKPHPPIGMSMVRGPSMAARMAGQRGYMPLSTNLVPSSTVVEHWENYCLGAAETGHTPDRSQWRVSRSILVADSNDEAWEHARNGTFSRSFTYMNALMKAANVLDYVKAKADLEMPDDEVTADYVLTNNCIIGDADSVTEQLLALYDETGGFGTLLMIAHDWDDKARWVRSMELLKNEVLPRLPTV